MLRLFNRMMQTTPVVLALTLSAPAQGATEGALTQGKGASSSGSLQVGLVVPELVRLTGVEDLMLNWDAGQQGFVASDGICVYRNMSGNYSVAASSGHGGGGEFRMVGDSGSSLPYEVLWNGDALSSGQRSTVRADAHKTAVDCDGGSNITLGVRASADQVSEASGTGLHTDTLTLEIIAE